ncbi:hypothetical protein LCM17_21060 [Cereibacter sphaeroides]|nr:hypothetical protein [Cereibacter sphaeroides]
MENEGIFFHREHPLYSAMLKIGRARTHVRSLELSMSPLSQNAYFMGWRPADETAPRLVAINTGSESELYDFAFVPKAPIAHTFGAVIGDAVHCLRASLDHAVTAAAHFARKDRKLFYFPFDESESQFIAAGRAKKLFGIFGEHETLDYFLNEVRPFKEGNFELWSLNKLDNLDKHNLIVPPVTVANVTLSGPIRAGNHRVANLAVGNPVDRPFTVLSLPKDQVPDLHAHAALTVECRFPDEWFEGAAAVEKLDSLIDIVAAQVSSFHRFAARRLPDWPRSVE